MPVTQPSLPHAQHDALLIAKLAADDTTSPERVRANALIVECPDCADLFRGPAGPPDRHPRAAGPGPAPRLQAHRGRRGTSPRAGWPGSTPAGAPGCNGWPGPGSHSASSLGPASPRSGSPAFCSPRCPVSSASATSRRSCRLRGHRSAHPVCPLRRRQTRELARAAPTGPSRHPPTPAQSRSPATSPQVHRPRVSPLPKPDPRCLRSPVRLPLRRQSPPRPRRHPRPRQLPRRRQLPMHAPRGAHSRPTRLRPPTSAAPRWHHRCAPGVPQGVPGASPPTGSAPDRRPRAGSRHSSSPPSRFSCLDSAFCWLDGWRFH